MSWHVCDDADDFYTQRQLVLDEHESLNCLAFAAIEHAKSCGNDAEPFLFCVFRALGTCTAHAIYSHQNRILVLSAMTDEQARLLWALLHQQGIEVHIAEGPRGAALPFAARWSDATGRPHQLEMNQGLYEVKHPVMPDAAGGTLAVATDNDEAQLSQFLNAFVAECFPADPTPAAQVAERVRRLIAKQKAYLWKNPAGEAVSMAAVVRESPNTASISLVYTPRAQRGRGYAANVVASLSHDQLRRGKGACNLYADLSNPTSTGVYMRIGYTIIGESVRVRLCTNDSCHPGGSLWHEKHKQDLHWFDRTAGNT